MPSESLSRGVLAIVPARGGSKGLPGKNLMPLGGHSLLSWSIRAGLSAKCVERVVVSTDDEAIAAEGRSSGADVPFLRPSGLASDTAVSVDVALHCLEFLEAKENYRPDWLVLLQPTSPLRTSADIEAAYVLTDSEECDAVIGVNEPAQHPLLAKTLDERGRLTSIFPEVYGRRQDIPKAYVPNGAIYFVRTEVLRRERTFYPSRSLGYVMPMERSVDIDSVFDFQVARVLFREREDLSIA